MADRQGSRTNRTRTPPGTWVNGEVAVNGDEVRRLVFPRTSGYDTAAVDLLLDRVAAELDAGRPVAHLIEDARFPWQPIQLRGGLQGGYSPAAVDWVLLQLHRQDDPAARADPWRSLPIRRYDMASPDGSATGLAGPARHGAAIPVAARVRAARDYARECAEAWGDFGVPPGARLSLVKTGVARSELRTAAQYALVSVRTAPTRALDRDGRTYRLSRVKAAQWPAVAAEIGDDRPGSPAHLKRTGPAPRNGKEAVRRESPAVSGDRSLKSLAGRTGPPVLYTGGRHINRTDHGYVQFPGRRWLRFPVRGTQRSNAIMTAVDQAGRQVARYRIADSRAIEITVHPDQGLTDELILMLALSARWVSRFFSALLRGLGLTGVTCSSQEAVQHDATVRGRRPRALSSQAGARRALGVACTIVLARRNRASGTRCSCAHLLPALGKVVVIQLLGAGDRVAAPLAPLPGLVLGYQQDGRPPRVNTSRIRTSARPGTSPAGRLRRRGRGSCVHGQASPR
jgi:DivIVA domain-containing protein